MIDLRKTVIPKSDQLNADDLIGQTRTIKVTKVSLLTEADQPIAIGYEDDGGKPYKPCKSMRRVMVNIWGPDGNAYVGRSMTIYRDDKVMFGGVNMGGIRISHMSNIDGPVTMALTVTRANRKPFTVQPLAVQTPPLTPAQIAVALRAQGDDAATRGKATFGAFWNGLGREQRIAAGGAPQRDLWLSTARTADESPRPSDEDLDDIVDEVFFSSPHTDHREEAAADASPVERRAGSPTIGPEGDPPPVPQEPPGPSNGSTEARPQGNTAPGGAPGGAAVAGAGVNAAAPSGRQSTSGDPELDARERRAEIRRDGDARAAAGTAALADFLEGLRKAGEADLVSAVVKSAWGDAAKAADAAKGRK